MAAPGPARASWWGDARSGKLAANLVGFGRALRRAGLCVDAQRMALAQQSLGLVGLAREDMAAALEAVLVSRAQDRGVFREMFAAYFRNPEVAQQLLTQLLPRAPEAVAPRRRPRVQEAMATAWPNTAPKPAQEEDELLLDAAMSAGDRQRLRHADFEQLSASEYRLVQQLVRDIALPLPRYRSRRSLAAARGAQLHWQASLAPQLRENTMYARPASNGDSATTRETAEERSPEEARSTITAIQQGWERGRSLFEPPEKSTEPVTGTRSPADPSPAETRPAETSAEEPRAEDAGFPESTEAGPQGDE